VPGRIRRTHAGPSTMSMKRQRVARPYSATCALGRRTRPPRSKRPEPSERADICRLGDRQRAARSSALASGVTLGRRPSRTRWQYVASSGSPMPGCMPNESPPLSTSQTCFPAEIWAVNATSAPKNSRTALTARSTVGYWASSAKRSAPSSWAGSDEASPPPPAGSPIAVDEASRSRCMPIQSVALPKA